MSSVVSHACAGRGTTRIADPRAPVMSAAYRRPATKHDVTALHGLEHRMVLSEDVTRHVVPIECASGNVSRDKGVLSRALFVGWRAALTCCMGSASSLGVDAGT